MICASLMALASIGIFFVNLEIRLMLTCVFFSNMTYLWSIIFVLGKSRADPRLNKKFDASFARLKTVFIFSGFLQIVAFVLSFEEGSFGGSCDDEHALPYLFDALYGLIAVA